MKRSGKMKIAVFYLAISTMFSSCFTYKEIFNDQYYVEDNKVEVVIEKLEVGDWIYLKVNGKKYRDLKVTGISDQTLSIAMYNSQGVASYYPLYIPYIQQIELRVPDPMYTLGAGYISLLLLFFLLV